MRPYATRLLALTIYATAAVVIPAITASGGEAANRHIRKHHPHAQLGRNDSWRRASAAQEVRPVAPSWSGGGDVCPGLARSFDCKIWPPPVNDDPDRKGTGGDGM